MIPVSAFIANMRAALEKWERSTDPDEKLQAEREMSSLIRGNFRESVDVRKRAANDE
jgi:hypothetical protein